MLPPRNKNFQDKIDAVLTHPIAGLPIFAIIMFLVFYISQSDGSLGLGVWLADLLEDCGYMARATVVLDPIFKKVGLSGKSVIPFVIGTGCAIPGVMACRTIRNERERRATAMLTPFMPCGAKLPVIALIVGLAVFYIRKEKRRGVQCVGCPDSKTCSGQCAHCSRCCNGAGNQP